ncbi:hypothetical protein BGZ98_003704, partial [Dissophora globulifera]
MAWLVLAGAAAEAVSQVLVVVTCGVILSRTGYLSQSAQKSISQVNLYFMTPCLLFTKIASTIDWEQFKAFWPIPVFFLLFSVISWTVARVGSRLLRFSADEEKFVIASVLFSNTNSLPMALIQSLALSAAGTRLLRDENDTAEQVAARGISYILFYAIFGNLVRWSYGFTLLVPNDPTDSEDLQDDHSLPEPQQFGEGVLINVEDSQQPRNHAVGAARSSVSTLFTVSERQKAYDDNTDDEDSDELETRSVHEPSPFFRAVQKPKNYHRSTHMRQLSPPASGTGRISRGQERRVREVSTKPAFRKRISTALGKIGQVLTPPLLTAIMALVIGLVPALHHFFMGSDSKFYAFVIHPIESCGEAAIPMILLCLGAQVVHFTSSSDSPISFLKGQLGQRGVGTIPAFSYSNALSDSGSSDEDQGHAHVGSPAPRYNYGQRGNVSSHSYASSSTTLNIMQHDDDAAANWTYDGATVLSLRGHRFKWITPTVLALVSRLLLVPAICLPAILFYPSSMSPILTEDPTFTLTLVLIAASPTAINLIQLTQ